MDPLMSICSNDNVRQKYTFLTELLPDADKPYLLHISQKYENNLVKLENFAIECCSNRATLTKKAKKFTLKRLIAALNTAEGFLQHVPDPVAYFYNENRESAIKDHTCVQDIEYGIAFLRTHFVNNYVKELRHEFLRNKYDIIRTADVLKDLPKKVHITRRTDLMTGLKTDNVELIKQIAYITNKTEIEQIISTINNETADKIARAKSNGTIATCQCCFDEEVIEEKQIICTENHTFCLRCVKENSEVLLGQGKIHFPCLVDCAAFFTLRDLQLALPPKLFSVIAQKKQLDEVKSAGIEDLKCCPFCEFAYIPQPEDSIFRCLNEKCLKHSCLACSELAHAPQTCAEVKEMQQRKNYVENEMTKSLVRTCNNCHMNFIKENGCNKMTCPCGSIMCYICKATIKDYSHFNGEGGDKYWLCPLFSDTAELHRKNLNDAKRRISIELNNNNNNGAVKKKKGKDKRRQTCCTCNHEN